MHEPPVVRWVPEGDAWALAEAVFRAAMLRHGLAPLTVDAVRERARLLFPTLAAAARDAELLRVEQGRVPPPDDPSPRRGLHPEAPPTTGRS
ncbi:hypothetical protein [Actinomadura atramentaria]|uniref:hypothetical protein n=1 Tax=Actinomadura atramentaria TaxID=1990 RepID=UPI00037E2B02|nr:hypothetical protein [Actinomadura atramentaria]